MIKKWCVLLLFLAIIVFVFQLNKIYSEKKINLFHTVGGDGFSQINAYTAGLNFAKYGFWNLYFLPITHEYKTTEIKKEDFYTHYPPGPDLVSGFLSKVGIKKYYSQKKILLIISFLTLFLYVLILNKLLNYKYQSLIFLSLILASPYFVFFAGNIHQFSYFDFCIAAGIYSLILEKRKIFYLICFVSLFFTFEIAPFLFVLALLTNWRNKKFLFLTFLAFCLSFGLHFLQNAWLYGSFEVALKDLLNAFVYRTGSSSSSHGFHYSFFTHLLKMIVASFWYYGIPVIFLAFFGFFKKRSFWLIAILIASFAWHIFFRQHAMIHLFTNRHFGFILFVLATIGFFELLQTRKIFAILLVLLAVLRIPLGCEISENKFLLTKFINFVETTDSITLGEVLYEIRNTQEHKKEKIIVLNEILKRNNLANNKLIYYFDINNKKFYLKEHYTSYQIDAKNIPQTIGNNFAKTDQIYCAFFDDDFIKEGKDYLVINGYFNKLKVKLISFYVFLI